MKNLITAILLLISTLAYAQTYDIVYNKFPANTDTVTWCGTNDLDTKNCILEVVFCVNCTSVFINGHVSYRKYYNHNNPKQLYWDIDVFTDEWRDPLHKSVEVLGFKLH